MNDTQPKPTSEWTVEVHERYLKLVDGSGNTICDTHQVFAHLFKSVADAHNAALSDEKETSRYWKEQWVERGAQLADEREK